MGGQGWDGVESSDTHEYAGWGVGTGEGIVETGVVRRGRGRLALDESAGGLWKGPGRGPIGGLHEVGILPGPDVFDLGDKIGGLVAEVTVLPRATITNATLSVFKDNGAGGGQVSLL